MKKLLIVCLAVAVLLGIGFRSPAAAKVISKRVARIYQIRIYQRGPKAGGPTQTYWSLNVNYVGPGDLNNLLSLEVFVNNRMEVEAVKIVRKTYDRKVVTSLLRDILDLSIEYVPPGSPVRGKDLPITVLTMDELKLP
jgi:hypothetical protein